MKKMWKIRHIMTGVLLTLVLAFCFQVKNVEASDDTKVMTLCLTDEENNVTEVDMYYQVTSSGSSRFYFEKSIYIWMDGAESKTLKISVKDIDTTILFPEYMDYEDEVTITNGSGTGQTISFMYQADGVYNTYYLMYTVYPYEVNFYISNLLTSASSKGFKPSNKNYILIRSNVYVEEPAGGQIDLRVRVLNKNKKYVFQGIMEDLSSGGCLNYSWNGKATKKNEAKVAANRYVKQGNYQVEVSLVFTSDDGREKIVSKRSSLKVKNTAPSGEKGLAKAKKIIQYTGTASIDYMAEQMLKDAGVKASMSDDAKVKKIYNYMTKNFKHDTGQTKKTYYNLTKLQKKIETYGKKAEKKLNNGKLVYNFYGSYAIQRTMVQKSGVCDYHAAVFKVLLNHVGIEAGVVGGYYKNRSGSLSPHAWNYAIVNGKTYYYDVDIEIQNYKKGQGDYYWYKKTYKQATSNHVFS